MNKKYVLLFRKNRSLSCVLGFSYHLFITDYKYDKWQYLVFSQGFGSGVLYLRTHRGSTNQLLS